MSYSEDCLCTECRLMRPLIQERDAALAALARVEALHVRDGNDPDPDTEWCAACGFGWPCSTIRALTEWNA